MSLKQKEIKDDHQQTLRATKKTETDKEEENRKLILETATTNNNLTI